jgi:hypothetical protein
MPIIFKLCFSFFIFLLSFKSLGQTDDFNQAQNGNAPSYNIEWINGILNSTHTTYFEGMSVPQRLIFTELPAGQVTLKIKFLAKKGDNHAYDFLTSWQQAYDAGAFYGGADNELQNLFIQQCQPNTSVSAEGQAVCASLSGSAFALNPEIPDVMGDGPFSGSPDIDGKITIYENSIKGATGFGNRTLEIKGSAAISNASVTFTGYDADYATYSIVWTNSAANTDILVRFAGHLAIGNGTGGYGAGLGAGSVNGGPYHFKFENLYNASNNAIFSGDQDNQIMSGAVQIPPSCGFENGTRGCPETTSFSFDYTSNTPNTSVTFSFLSNTANATFNSSGTAQTSTTLTTDGSGNVTVTVYPQTGGFTAGGNFRISAVSTAITCNQETSTVIESASVTASADPTTINLNAASHSSTLTALGTIDGVQDNSLFVSFTWAAVLDPGFDDGSAGLSSTSGATVTFTPTFAGSFKFRVTAVSATGCTATATVIVTVTAGGTCPANFTGPNSVCASTTGLVYSVDGPIPQFTHYDWSIVNNLATITSATHDVTSITVDAGTVDFVVRITVSFDNTNIASFTCDHPVSVHECGNNCSYTQGYYGGNGKSCDNGIIYNTPQEMLTHLLSIGGDIVIGNGGKSVTIPNSAAGVSALYSALPGGSTPTTLPAGNCNITTACWTAKVGNIGVYLTKQGKINNVLLSQTITLELNSRLNGGSLSSFPIEDGILTTLARNGCDGDPIPGTEQYFQFNTNVVAYLEGTNAATVAGLQQLAEDLLGGAKKPGDITTVNAVNYIVPTYAEVNSAVDVVNRAFDKCRASFGYSDPLVVARIIPTAIQQEAAALSVQAYPNPFTDKVRFTILSPVAGKAQLDVYNMLGQKLQTVYSGYVQAHMSQSVEFNIPARAQQNLIYILQVGNERLTGKLLKAGK